MAAKLDIYKAYNRLEWSFSESMMKKLGFSDIWIFQVMTCVATTSYTVLLNGTRGPSFSPQEAFAKETFYPHIST